MFSMEMSSMQLCYRILSGESIIGSRAMFQGSLSPEQQDILRQTAEDCKDWSFFTDCTQGLDIQQIRSRARKWKRKYGLEALGIDFAQLARSRRFQDNKVLEVADIARNCKEMAVELGIPVFLLSQLNCDSDAIPTKTSLKDSKALAEAADVILLMHQESSDSENAHRVYKLNIAKQREGQEGIVFDVDYLAWRTHFQEKNSR
jgi:replicative DNA helicase